MTVIDPTTARRLAEIQERTRGARDRIAQAKKDRDRAAENADFSNGVPDKSSEQWRAFAAAEDRLASANAELEQLRDEERYWLRQANGVDGVYRRESIFQDPNLLAECASWAHSKQPIGDRLLGVAVDAHEMVQILDAGDFGPRRLAAAGDVTVTDAQRRGTNIGVVREPRRPLLVIDLVQHRQMTGASVEYTIVSTITDAATGVPEGAIKPAAEYAFEDGEAKAVTLAHYVRARRQVFADAPEAERLVRDRLLWGLVKVADDQIVSGPGGNDNLLGILNTTGVASVPYSATPPLGELLLDGAVATILGDHSPTGVVLHPSDWKKMLIQKASGSGDYFGGGPFGGSGRSIWGLPAVVTRACPAGTAIVGDWSEATLWVREGANIRGSDSDSDAFIRHQLVVLAETRLALTVFSPEAFAVIDLAA
jgi:HK97 family phage major capsid protein